MKDEVISTLLIADAHRAVLEAAALAHGPRAALALVIATDGSTYVRAGAMALFDGAGGQAGWLSGGCLEPEIQARALAAAEAGQVDWMELDTRDDEDLLSGSAVGCRGRLHLALLPLALLPGLDRVVAAWRDGADFTLSLQADSEQHAALEIGSARWSLPCTQAPTPVRHGLELLLNAPPHLAVLGAGPETPHLLPLMRDAGWVTTLVERRPRWAPGDAGSIAADHWHACAPVAGLALPGMASVDAVLVMHHNFELDREALEALAATDIPFIGLLGPPRRREDLFRLLPAGAVTALGKRLRSPVGLDLGGRGAHAISLSIAAQLQAWHHGRTG